jgi:hypothetical protein
MPRRLFTSQLPHQDSNLEFRFQRAGCCQLHHEA